MGLNISGLPSIPQLSSVDQILVCTPDGLKTLTAEVLGKVLSDTSLYDNLNILESQEINVQNISTHNKLRKYLSNDTSSEVYLEYKNGQVNFIKDVVIYDINTKEPVVVQATDLQGNPLYWNHDIDNAEFSEGMPWKTDEGDKISVTRDKTEWPVKIYQYTSSYIKKSEISLNASGEPTITDTFLSNGQSSVGTIQKVGNSFIFQLKESGKSECGLKISLNNDGTVTGKLIGIWDGLNDWDVEDVLTKEIFKNWFYNNQDYNLYSRILSVNTADKIGWRLSKDTNNHVYTEIDGDEVTVYLAQNKISGSGVYIQEQAKNVLNQPLYWKQDMEQHSGVSSNHIPVYSGSYTFMTTEKTDWPVYIYQYDITKLFVVTVESLTDNSKGAKLTFTGANGKKGEIFRTLTQFVMRYLDSSGKVVSSISLGDSESLLTGTWKAGTKSLSANELPNKVTSSSKKALMLENGNLNWEDLPKELPNQVNDGTKRALFSVNGGLSWGEESKELPDKINDSVKRVLTSKNGNYSWEKPDVELPNQTNDGEVRVLVSTGGVLSWKTLSELGITDTPQETPET